MKKVLFVATVVRLHINMFHKPFINWFHEQGWQVDVAANNDYDHPEECVIENCDHFYCLPFERSPVKKGNVVAYHKLQDILRKENYDIIHCHTPMGGVISRLAAIQSRKYGTKVIYTAHGFHFFEGAPLVNWLLYYPIERSLSRITDVLITMNKEDYKRAHKFHANKVIYIPGIGLNLSKFQHMEQSEMTLVRKELGLDEEDVFAISVAQLIPRKNHILLIQAMKKINNSKVHLFICGDGSQEEYLNQEIKKMNMEHNIHLLGFRKDVYRLCGAADLFLFASLQEGLPVAVMEAMACGLPIVCSNIRGNADLIEEGKGGYLADPSNIEDFVQKIGLCLKEKDNLNRMKEYNLNKIKEYSIETVLREMSNVYKNCLE